MGELLKKPIFNLKKLLGNKHSGHPLGSYRWSFQESCDHWSCDISRSDFNSFWYQTPDEEDVLFRLLSWCSTCVQIIPCGPLPYTSKKYWFLTAAISILVLCNSLCTFFTLWDSMSCFLIMYTMYLYKMYVVVVV